MPELPEIEVLRRSLERRLSGRRVERVRVHAPALREPLDRRSLGGLRGRRIEGLRRRSKYLLVDFEGGRTLVVHLGMSGRLTLAPLETGREPHEHLAFELDAGEKLRLRDPRRFGLAFVAPTRELESDPHFLRLGREPLEPPVAGADLAALAAGRRAPVKPFLMDASTLVGVGNIYATEALFRARIHPARSVATLRAPDWDRLAVAVVGVLEEAIREGGTTLNDFADGEGNSGYFQVSLEVYDREGAPCPKCGARIRRLVQSNRSGYYCPRCQRAPRRR
ncbi:MAG: bifunctional DNA-formamidopyrimidine glycosylase/DNA-(apurinic or apyrimidinic site) lyase [Acidobacteria bacterium]|nr:bifunctional DNA-formamidopyrimidine glycosylase/DNA-(apurinic or apyrimidinic site) lyase [Acidobacteriota bacterium]MCB9378588.1 bifunctional DNA-formamidopyrimidine glycosylase/DNA-(apurinic or apyrimidinic site) lyase [Holophagales bacterium]